ncbi:hypothetical protein HU200_029045 [Digitaria exilis]|uniref:F-box domain-containing protein n=1 Tax=Digitaria exilis TaxID=1010633 RepID=A0A835BTS7_9POAL|nr:hypothetical protein HU200_029045 [Digitaria exilis]
MGKQGTRRNKSKPRAKQRRQLPSLPTSVHDLPDELLDRVLLGLGSPLDLVRAAATCRRWRRAIADESFLGRSHDLHGAPCVAGPYYVTDAQPPNTSREYYAGRRRSRRHLCPRRRPSLTLAASSPLTSSTFRRRKPIALAARTTTTALPGITVEIIDSRGSLLLLTNEPWREHIDRRRWSPDFIVCEPVSQRYPGILRPVDLSHLPLLGAFLFDGGGRGRRHHVKLQDRPRYQFGTPRACVFTPGSDGGWQTCCHTMEGDVEVPLMETIHLAGRSGGRVYWGIEDGTVLVLDESTLKFSVLTFPAQMQGTYRRTSFRVIGGAVSGEDGVRVVRVHGEDLEVFGKLPDSGEWVMEKSAASRLGLGLPVPLVSGEDRHCGQHKTWLFSVELETMEVEQEHERNRSLNTKFTQ